jgi:CubicO group peptidase (beta-lactamase class C family)
MRKFIFILVIAVSCSTPPKNAASSEINVFENSLSGEVYFEGDSLWNIEERMKHYSVPGASIAIIKDNKIVFSKAYGIMDRETKEPVTTTTLFQAASISKPVSAYAALKTVEMGKVNLTDDVNTWLTSWKVPDNEFTKEQKVTLAGLLSHTAGTTVSGFPGYPKDPIPTAVQVLDGIPPANTGPVRVDKVPGGNFRYSGGGYTAMQQMMIDVHGKPFPTIMQELVLGPLEMTNSAFDQPLDSNRLKTAATGYFPDDTQVDGKQHTYPELAAAGLWTTPEDLAKFAIDIQKTLKGEGNKVLSKDMVEKMLTSINNGPIALGMGIRDLEGSIYFEHSGWNAGFSSQLISHKENGYGIVVMINSNKPDFIQEVVRAAAITYSWENYLPTYKKLAIDTTVFKRIVGRYRNGSDGRITISNDGDKLFFKFIRNDDPEQLFQISDSTYVLKNTNAVIQFKKLPDGQIDLVISKDKRHAGSHLKVGDKEFVPYEYLLAGDFNNAVKGYQALMKADANDNSVDWDNLDNQAHRQQEQGNDKLAQDLFRINSILHANVKK